MQIKWKKLLFKFVGLNFLSQEAGKWMHHFKEDLKERARYWILQSSVWLMIWVLLKLTFIFGLLGLSLYLNERFYSTYLGFLITAAGCISMIVLLWIISLLFKPKPRKR